MSDKPKVDLKLASPAPKSWRDILPVHPAANRIPEPTDEEKCTLASDLRDRGQRIEAVLIRVACDPEARLQLLDGRTRLDLQEAAGVKVIDADGRLLVPHKVMQVQDDAEAENLSLSLNVHRRHLNAKQRQNAFIQIIARAPEKSDRQIAKDVGVDHKTIAKARAKGEDVGSIPHVGTRADTKGRRQPAKKARKAVKDRKQPEQSKHGWKVPTRFASADDCERRKVLGSATVNRLRKTSLGSSFELNQLAWLNRGMPPGEHTPLVAQLITDALAGKKVTCPVEVDGVISPSVGTAGQVDIGASPAEAQWLRSRIEQLESEKHRLEIVIEGFKAEIEDCKAELAAATAAYPGGKPFIRASETLRRALSSIACSVGADISPDVVVLHEREALNALRTLSTVLDGADIDEVTIIHRCAKEDRRASTRKGRKKRAA